MTCWVRNALFLWLFEDAEEIQANRRPLLGGDNFAKFSDACPYLIPSFSVIIYEKKERKQVHAPSQQRTEESRLSRMAAEKKKRRPQRNKAAIFTASIGSPPQGFHRRVKRSFRARALLENPLTILSREKTSELDTQ